LLIPPRIIQERETREKLKKEKAEVCLHNANVDERWLTFRQREAKEKKEVCNDVLEPPITLTRDSQAEEKERKEVQFHPYPIFNLRF
jgi:hypothetical protein